MPLAVVLELGVVVAGGSPGGWTARGVLLAVANGIFAVALLQGALAWAGFALFGVPFSDTHGDMPSWAAVKDAADKMLVALAELEKRRVSQAQQLAQQAQAQQAQAEADDNDQEAA